MLTNDSHHRVILQNIAHRVMLERGLQPDFSAEALAELERLQAPTKVSRAPVHDLKDLLWASIDNDDSRDLDQLTVAEALPGGKVKVLVAIADVDSLVKDGSAIDEHARHNTTSVYTAAETFPMLPERLSTDLTSLNQQEDRLAIIVEIIMGADGSLQDSTVYQGLVRNRAKLAYHSVAAWLDGNGGVPAGIAAVDRLEENLRIQDKIAQSMKAHRHALGSLSLETLETKPVFDGDQIQGLEVEAKDRARELVEEFMIAANGVVARYLTMHKFPSIRRVVRTPKRWERIVELAQERGASLPIDPDSKSLETFLVSEKAADPLRFPDLSLAIIKLLGAGEYVAEAPDGNIPGHFGLAVKDYAHSTAPNRRYSDLITQRLVKAAIMGDPSPYALPNLDILAKHFTAQEDAANKVERQVGKSAAALLLKSKIGQTFDAIVTGAADKGTWARLVSIPAEGKVEQGYEGLDVGQRVRLQLISVDVDRGYIDFRAIGSPRHK